MQKKCNFLLLAMLLIITTLVGCGRKTEKVDIIKEGTTITFYAWSENKDAIEMKAEKVEMITNDNINKKIQEYSILPSNVNIQSVEKLDPEVKLLQIDYTSNFSQYISSLDQSEEYLTVTTIVNTFLDAYGYDKVKLTCNGEAFKTENRDYSEFIEFTKDLKNPYYVEEVVEEPEPEIIDEYAKMTTLFDAIDNTYEGTNLLISPISIFTELSILDDAAVNETKDLIDGYLGNQRDIKNNYESLLIDPNLKLYNAIFYHKGGTDSKEITVEFAKELEKYQTEIFNSNMNLRDTSLATVNNWVSAKTKNDIPKFLTTISKDTQLYLININKFDLKFNSSVYNLEFETDEDSTKLVKMIEFTGDKFYYETEAATGIGMDVNNARYKLVCIMPNNSRSKLSSINLTEFMETESTINKNCYIPIISINNTTKLNKPLSSLELAPIFTEKSDFSAMFDNVTKSFGVTEIAQINYFNFNSSYNTDDSVNLVSNSENNNQETESTSDLEEVITEQTSDESNEEGNTETETTETEESNENKEKDNSENVEETQLSEESNENKEAEDETIEEKTEENTDASISDDNAEKIATNEEKVELENNTELVDIANSYILSQKFYYMIIDNKTNAVIFLGKYSR